MKSAPPPGEQSPIHLAHSVDPVIPRDRLIRLPEVEAITGCRKSTIYNLIKQGKFAAPIRVTGRMAAWSE